MPDSQYFLITRPAYDPPTYYLAEWSKKVVEAAIEKGKKVIELTDNAKREHFEKCLEKNDPALVVFNGHGEDDLITGCNKDEILVKAGDNEEVLKNRIACAISCNSAKTLGPKSIKAGAIAFVGFVYKFVLMHEERHSATPLRDKTAGHFLEPANIIPISLLKGNSVQEAYDKSQAAFDKSIDYFRTHYTPENSHILFWLTYDKKIQKMCGNGSATL